MIRPFALSLFAAVTVSGAAAAGLPESPSLKPDRPYISTATDSRNAEILHKALDAAGIVCNYNLIPEDPRSARRPSGIRIGTPAVTSRGFGIEEMALLGNWMARVAQVRADEGLELADRKQRYAGVASEVRELCDRFPAPGLTPEA